MRSAGEIIVQMIHRCGCFVLLDPFRNEFIFYPRNKLPRRIWTMLENSDEKRAALAKFLINEGET
jgi:hypothetical protein